MRIGYEKEILSFCSTDDESTNEEGADESCMVQKDAGRDSSEAGSEDEPTLEILMPSLMTNSDSDGCSEDSDNSLIEYLFNVLLPMYNFLAKFDAKSKAMWS